MNQLQLAADNLIQAWKTNWARNGWELEMQNFERSLRVEVLRVMNWADIVPFGYYATWACEPNQMTEQLRNMLARYSPASGETK